MIATSYPLLDIFLTILWVFGFVVWIWLLILIFGDVFRSHDMSGWAKALWVVFVIVLPLVGVLAYLIVRGGGMHERSVRQAQQAQQSFDTYVRQTAGETSTADQVAKLADLKSQGVLTDAEFEQEKAKLLS